MAGSKTIKSGKMTPVRGGKGHMFGKQHAGPQKGGIGFPDAKSSGGKWGKGGKSGQVGKQGVSRKAEPGKTSLPSWGGKK